MQTLPAGVEDLGRLAAECDFWADQREMSLRDRHDLHKRAQAYRDEQFRLLECYGTPLTREIVDAPSFGDYLYADGPNKSQLPDEDTGNALIGAAWGFIFFGGFMAVVTVAVIIWRTYAH